MRGLKIYLAPRHGLKKLLGIYETEITNAIQKTVKPDDVCIDVGCHIGYITLALRKFVGEKGFVLAVDPILSNCELVAKSAQANNFSNIKTKAVALGDVDAEVSAHVFSDSDMANFADSGFINYSKETCQNFKVTTLDTLVAHEKLTTVDFIKLDVEGYEYKVLLGASQVIAKYTPTFLIEVHTLEIWPKIYDLLTTKGYNFYDLHTNQLAKETPLDMTKIFHVVARVGDIK